MEMNLITETLINLLKQHYKSKEDFIGTITINPKKELLGYGMNTYEGVILNVKRVGTITLLEEQIPVEFIIFQDEIESILKEELEQAGYEINNILFNKGISSKWEGYGLAEHEVKTAYFTGITVTGKKKEYQKIK